MFAAEISFQGFRPLGGINRSALNSFIGTGTVSLNNLYGSVSPY